MFRYGPLILIFPKLSSWRDVGFCQMLSEHLKKWSFVLNLNLILWNMLMDFCILKPFLHPWDEAYLIMLDDLFDMFLDLICENFIEYFCVNTHKGNWSDIWIFNRNLKVHSQCARKFNLTLISSSRKSSGWGS